MLQELGTFQAVLIGCILSHLSSKILQFAELEIIDTAIVALIPILIVPRLAQGQKLGLGKLEGICEFVQ